MNQIIKDLVERAMVEAPHEMGGTYMAFSKEKFAELIVKECIVIVNEERCNPYRNLSDREEYGISACREIEYKIKRKFGNRAELEDLINRKFGV